MIKTIRHYKINVWVVQVLVWLALFGYAVFALFPVLWTVLTSFKSQAEVQQIPPTWLPHKFTLENYAQVIQKTPVLLSLRNSIIIAIGTITLCLILGLPAAYGFSRFRFPGHKYLLLAVLGSRVIAPPALVVPFMALATRLHIVDTFYVLILADTYMWLPFLIWLMKGTFDLIPVEIIEAAKIDGCSNVGIFFRTILPLSMTGFISVMILMFVDTWNELLFALAFTQSPSVKPITTTMLNFYTDIYTVYGWMTAAGVLGVIPAILFALFFQRYIVKGIVSGAVKG
jgi:multiple sugar transport system permease protein